MCCHRYHHHHQQPHASIHDMISSLLRTCKSLKVDESEEATDNEDDIGSNRRDSKGMLALGHVDVDDDVAAAMPAMTLGLLLPVHT